MAITMQVIQLMPLSSGYALLSTNLDGELWPSITGEPSSITYLVCLEAKGQTSGCKIKVLLVLLIRLPSCL